MSTALSKLLPLKAEIRLAQAVSDFEHELTPEQKAQFRTRRLQSTNSPPNSNDVMRLTAEIDQQISRKYGGQCFGPRFTNFLQGVQQFAALGDVVVGGSQNIIACGVWSLVRMTILSLANVAKYADKLSSLFMDIGRASPRHQAMALLYPRSTKLQSYLLEYFHVVVATCRHIHQFSRKSTLGQLASALNDAKMQAFRSDLDQWATHIKEETALYEHQANAGYCTVSKKTSEFSSQQHNLTAKLRILDFCSKYNYQTAWKQTKKAGRTSFFEQRVEYQTWRDYTSSRTLVCMGKLGSGKSVLLANIVDDLNLCSNSQDYTTTYFFCRDGIPESLQARTIIGSLARQMLCSLPDLVHITGNFDFTQTDDLEAVIELLNKCLRPHHKPYVVLDGIDDCDQSEKEAVLIQLLKLQTTFKVLICTSMRFEPHAGTASVLERLPPSRVLLMPENNPDINKFIEAELIRCVQEGRLQLGDPELILEIEDSLVHGAQGMFLWASLQIQSICSMKTDQAIREACPSSSVGSCTSLVEKAGHCKRRF